MGRSSNAQFSQVVKRGPSLDACPSLDKTRQMIIPWIENIMGLSSAAVQSWLGMLA